MDWHTDMPLMASMFLIKKTLNVDMMVQLNTQAEMLTEVVVGLSYNFKHNIMKMFIFQGLMLTYKIQMHV